MGQMKMTKEQATKAAKLFGLGKEETLLLQEVPYRGSLPQVPPTDPLIYRFYELVQVYGTTWKELIQEEFGDGIMSAIDFDMTMERQPDQKGDRVKIAMSGKFLGYKILLSRSADTRPCLGMSVRWQIVNNRRSARFRGELALSDLSTPELGLGPVPKATLRAHIAERLRAAILAGDIAPGAPLTETALSTRFDVSRGPLREAMRQLIEEGLLVTVPYTGTHVAALSVEDVREIYSLRTALEIFAFEQVWEHRDDRFRRELHRRNEALLASIDAGDDRTSISTELALHGLVFEASGHKLLQRAWHGLRGRLQLYWAAHHRAHGRRGPRRDSHDSYISGGSRRRSRRAAPGDRRPHAPRRGGHGEVRFGGIEEGDVT